jgi:hypothetical protein
LCDRIEELVLDGSFTRLDLTTLLPELCTRFECVLEAEAAINREQTAIVGEFGVVGRGAGQS